MDISKLKDDQYIRIDNTREIAYLHYEDIEIQIRLPEPASCLLFCVKSPEQKEYFFMSWEPLINQVLNYREQQNSETQDPHSIM